jgi:hypothetical protein
MNTLKLLFFLSVPEDSTSFFPKVAEARERCERCRRISTLPQLPAQPAGSCDAFK